LGDGVRLGYGVGITILSLAKYSQESPQNLLKHTCAVGFVAQKELKRTV